MRGVRGVCMRVRRMRDKMMCGRRERLHRVTKMRGEMMSGRRESLQGEGYERSCDASSSPGEPVSIEGIRLSEEGESSAGQRGWDERYARDLRRVT